MSNILIIPKVNPLRLVITQLEGLNTAQADNRLFKDLGAPYFDQIQYYKPYQKSDTIYLQIVSSFDTSNVAKLHKLSDDAEILTASVDEFEFGGNNYFEFTIDLSAVDEDDYYVAITGSDADMKTYAMRSEPVRVKESWPGSVLFTWYNFENNFDAFYNSGVIFESRLRGQFVKPADGHDATIYDDDSRSLVMLEGSVSPARLLELYRAASWELEIINRALSHDFVAIDGEQVVSGNRLSHDYGSHSLLASPTVILELKSGGFTNTHDQLTRTTVPSAPENLQTSITGGDEITVDWDAYTDTADSLELQYSNSATFDSNVTTVSIADESSIQYVVSGLTADTWYFRLRAVNGTLKSLWSNTSSENIDSFVFSVLPDNTSTGSTPTRQFKLPLISSGNYNFIVNWGDGNTDTITTWNQAETTHQYLTSDLSFTISISGVIEGWQYNFGGDVLKIFNITNWGTLTINSPFAFAGCENLIVSATDAPILDSIELTSTFRRCRQLTSVGNGWDVSGVQRFTRMFNECDAFNQDISDWDMSFAAFLDHMFEDALVFNQNISVWDVSGVTDFNDMFEGALQFNQPIGAWNTGNTTAFTHTLRGASAFDQDISSFDIRNVQNMTLMMEGVTLSTANYDALLIAWEAQAVQDNVDFHAGNSQYTTGGAAAAARAALIADHNWTITDGGAV